MKLFKIGYGMNNQTEEKTFYSMLLAKNMTDAIKRFYDMHTDGSIIFTIAEVLVPYKQINL